MSHHAQADHPVHELIAARWSPYAYSDRPVAVETLRSLFEAARWAASSYNEQPWNYLVATRDDPANFEKAVSCLVEANQEWARLAPVLAFGCANLKFARNGQPNGVALHDLGAASAQLSIEAVTHGLQVHQMGGILPDRIREVYQVPDGVQPVAALAIGYPGHGQQLSDQVGSRDAVRRPRKALSEFVFSGRWGTTAAIVR
ncbi:MAG: nitroreductase family protein [Planctomycetes bacterium]|nr:nitroreductase family protein [Planctomycetota bacterium]